MREILLHLSPYEGAVEKHVGAVLGVHHGTASRVGFLAVEHERQRFVVNLDQLCRVFGDRAAVGNHRGYPLSGIAGNIHREGAPRDFRRVETGKKRRGCSGKLTTVEHVVHATARERRGLIDVQNTCSGMRARHHGDVPGSGEKDVGSEAALAGDEATILAHAAVARDEPERPHRAHGLAAG